jgi:hypothetical protein
MGATLRAGGETVKTAVGTGGPVNSGLADLDDRS